MKIGRLSDNPAQEFRHRGMRAERFLALPTPRQLGVAEIGVDCPVAYGMQRHDRPTARPPRLSWAPDDAIPATAPEGERRASKSLPQIRSHHRDQMTARALVSYQIFNLIIQSRKHAGALPWTGCR
jgi:hypothetical protein